MNSSPSIGEWLKKTWYTYRMEFYSDIKTNQHTNEIMAFAGKWMDGTRDHC